MGVTLHALVEQWFPPNEWRHSESWNLICTWEFGKNYAFSGALYKMPYRKPWPLAKDLSCEAQELLACFHDHQLIDGDVVAELEYAIEMTNDDESWPTDRPRALLSAVESLIGRDVRVRILFYRA